jgi:hypothetical protein
LYPAAPLSWLAPLWFFLCGVAASGGWAWTGSNLLKLLLGLLLAGPLLGLAWGAVLSLLKGSSTLIYRWASMADDPPANAASSTVAKLPYTLPGSASHRLARRLATVLAWWQQAKTDLQRPLLQMTVSTVFALAVAAQLGRASAGLTALGLLAAHASGLSQRHWGLSPAALVSLPLLLAWLLGHAVFSVLRPASAIVAASFALSLAGSFALYRGLKPLAWQIAPQVIAAASLVLVKQPVAAAVVALLGTPQLLLVSLLASPANRERYFSSVQFYLAASTFIAALALGYKP